MSITVTVPAPSGNPAPDIVRRSRADQDYPAYPQFIVQHTWPAHFKVVAAGPESGDRSVDGVDYIDFHEAKAAANAYHAAATS